MAISKIHIKNYRAIEDITLDFNKGINLLYGINGVGKSSILFAIHDLLLSVNSYIFKNEHQQYQKNTHVYHETRIRNLNEEAKIKIEFDDGDSFECIYDNRDAKDKRETKQRRRKSHHIRINDTQNLYIDAKSHNTVHFKSYFPSITSDRDEVKVIANINPNYGIHNVNHPLFLQENKKPDYVSCRGIDYIYFKKTFEALENIENQKIREGNQLYRVPALEKIRKGIKLVFGYFDDIHVDRTKQDNPIVVKKNGTELNLDNQLSSGEANIIALISSIALNLYKDETNSNSIVLIDEIENSLNPQLQNKICSVLKELFNNTQFIISSHSPFIWGGLNREEIVWLVHDGSKENNVTRQNVDYAIGGSIEEICANFFGLDMYSDLISEDIKDIDSLIEQKKLKEAKTKIEAMRKKYGEELPLADSLEFRMRFFE